MLVFLHSVLVSLYKFKCKVGHFFMTCLKKKFYHNRPDSWFQIGCFKTILYKPVEFLQCRFLQYTSKESNKVKNMGFTVKTAHYWSYLSNLVKIEYLVGIQKVCTQLSKFAFFCCFPRTSRNRKSLSEVGWLVSLRATITKPKFSRYISGLWVTHGTFGRTKCSITS